MYPKMHKGQRLEFVQYLESKYAMRKGVEGIMSVKEQYIVLIALDSSTYWALRVASVTPKKQFSNK